MVNLRTSKSKATPLTQKSGDTRTIPSQHRRFFIPSSHNRDRSIPLRISAYPNFPLLQRS